jgi:hypothetical protein
MSWFYPVEKKLTNNDLESYAHACYDIICSLGGDSHCKMYDPLTIEGKTAHSYVFDLEDGGRHHTFKNLTQLKEMILKETVDNIKNLLNNYGNNKRTYFIN